MLLGNPGPEHENHDGSIVQNGMSTVTCNFRTRAGETLAGYAPYTLYRACLHRLPSDEPASKALYVPVSLCIWWRGGKAGEQVSLKSRPERALHPHR